MKNVEVSIIVPVYNEEENIESCLKTLLAQSFKSIEIICVDDGSVDESKKIILDYQRKYEQIKYYFKENGGVSSARNKGIEEANGEYVVFVDSDDSVEMTYIEKLYNCFQKPAVDLAVCSYTTKDFSGEIKSNCNLETKIMDTQEVMKSLLRKNAISSALWNKMFRLSTIREFAIMFNPSITIGEDMLFLTQYVLHIRKAYQISDKLYTYMLNANGAMLEQFHAKEFQLKWLSEWDAISEVEKIVRNYNIDAENEIYLKKVRIADRLISRMDYYEYRNKEYMKVFQQTLRKKPYIYILSKDFEKTKKISAILNCFSPKLCTKVKRIRKRNRKIFLHAYCNNNLGDDLFIQIVTQRYRNIDFYVVAKKQNTIGIKNIPNLHIINNNIFYKGVNKFSKILIGYPVVLSLIIRKCNLSLILGGSMFMQGKNWKEAYKYIETIFLFSKKVSVIGANFGPYRDTEFLEVYKKILGKTEYTCFREEYSYNLFRELPNIYFAPDIVFDFTPKIVETKKKCKQVTIIPINLEERSELKKYADVYKEKLVQLCIESLNEGYNLSLVSFCTNQGDREVSENILNMIPERFKRRVDLYEYRGNLHEILGVLQSSEIVISSRFHGMILGWLVNAKVYPVIYSDKMIHVLDDILYKGEYSLISDLDDLSFDKVKNNQYTIDIEKCKRESLNQFYYLDKFIKNKGDEKIEKV